MTDRPRAPGALTSIRQYLLTRIVGIVVFSFVLFALAAWLIVLRPAQDELARLEMDRAASQVEGQFRSLIEQIERVLVTSRDWGRQGMLRIDRPQDLAALMIPVLRTRQQLSQVLLANTQGQALHFVAEPAGGWVIREIDAAKLGNRQHHIYLNAEGGYLREEWVQAEPYDPRTRPWYRGAEALANESDVHWTEPYVFFASKEPGITAAMRWTDRNTGERMVLAMDVLLLDLSRYTGAVTVGKNGRAAILTADGRLLGVPRHPDVRNDKDIKQRVLKTLRDAGMQMLAEAYERWVADQEAQASLFDVGSDTWIGRVRALPLRNQKLLIATAAPRADFVVGKPRDAAAIVVMMGLVLLLAFLFARSFSARFGGVMRSLAGESERIGAMQLDKPVQVPTRIREIGTLVEAQERMRLMLIDATHGLEEKVRERTAALNEALERQSAIFAASPYGIGVFQNRRCVACSPSFERAFGYAPGEFTGLGARALFRSDEDFDAVGVQVYTATGRGESLSYEVLLRRKDGSEFWCRVTAAPLAGQESQRGIVALYEDITPRKEAENALRAAHGEMDAILESASIGIALTRKGSVVRANQKAEELFGYGKGELLGVTVQILFATSGEDTIPEALARLGRGETHRREKQLTRKDGSQFWCRFAGRAVDSSDTSKGNVWMLEDITEEHAAAEALREAKRIAEDATQAKSMFLANMSHEIRTPMNAIIGMSHLALKTDLNPRQRDYVSKVHNAGTSLLGIINDILDFSKVEAGKLDIEHVPFRLDDVLDNVSSLIAQKAYDKGLELLFDTAADVPQALIGDPLRLGQIVTNLVSNAVKFTERGQIAVTVRRVERAGEKVQLRVEVRDSGIGMTREQAGRLFQAFTQADGSTTRKYGGTGLGLTISKRLVELMGGNIQVDSEPGSGSCFSFTSWFGLGDEASQRRRVLPEQLNDMRVLVADDNAAAREILGEMLRGLGFSVSAVASGAAAVDAVRQAASDHPFGVVFVDWRMPPGMDGAQAAREIRGLPNPPRIVMVTAFGREDVRAQAEDAGIEGFLVKPVSQSSLVDAMVGLFAPGAGATAHGAARGTEVRLDGVRLLLAEDNEINQQIAVELLEGVGARLDIANNGLQAVEKLAAAGPEAYDAVLMDLQMPEMGGIEATQRIRAEARFAKLPVIAMTAHAMVEERERCLAAGMVDHITKPIDPQALFQTLARWVKVARPASASAARPGAAAQDNIPDVDGLDSAGGLKRVAGNRKLYLSLLRQFTEKQSDACARVAAALARGDHAEAERIAHSVKGVAGNIGLAAVQASAGALEQAARTKQGVKAAATKLEADMARAIAALGDALPAGAPAAAAPAPVDAAQAADSAARLAALLANGDGEAQDYLASKGAAVRSLFADGDYAAFERQVNDFDFETALASLRRAAAARGIALQGEAT